MDHIGNLATPLIEICFKKIDEPECRICHDK